MLDRVTDREIEALISIASARESERVVDWLKRSHESLVKQLEGEVSDVRLRQCQGAAQVLRTLIEYLEDDGGNLKARLSRR